MFQKITVENKFHTNPDAPETTTMLVAPVLAVVWIENAFRTNIPAPPEVEKMYQLSRDTPTLEYRTTIVECEPEKLKDE